VFPGDALAEKAFVSASALRGEVFSFQLAIHAEEHLKEATLSVKSELQRILRVRRVGMAPCELPFIHWDEGMIRREPGLYPDPLLDLIDGKFTLFPGQWRCLWITVELPKAVKAGRYPIEIAVSAGGEKPEAATFTLTVLDAVLPTQTLLQTQWFHADCLSVYYRAPVLSEAWWGHVGRFMKNASAHGINMILTPLFTPPLDTKVGGERPTVQLVGVEKNGSRFHFDFAALKQWIELAQASGVATFEMSHLFTQWGAGFAPKIVVHEKGVEKKLFGWHTPAMDKPYQDFLAQFLPALVHFIYRAGIRDKVFFHVSDEPGLAHLEAYKAAAASLSKHLADFPVIDALSSIEFYRTGAVKRPVPANNHIEDFVKEQVPGLWTYYCVSQWKKVPNRYFNMPSARNRVLGFLLWKYKIEGFLHWGFNFWHTQYSLRSVNPFENTDAGHGFPSGDAFLVYPGEDGPVDSLRHEVHREGLQDMRALQLLEKKIGREKTLALLERGLKSPLMMDEYPRDAAWLLSTRERINKELEKLHK
jgi:hypothetical protein